MASEKKMRKVSRKLHWGRAGSFLKEKGVGLKGISFFNASQRKENNKIKDEEVIYVTDEFNPYK